MNMLSDCSTEDKQIAAHYFAGAMRHPRREFGECPRVTHSRPIRLNLKANLPQNPGATLALSSEPENATARERVCASVMAMQRWMS